MENTLSEKKEQPMETKSVDIAGFTEAGRKEYLEKQVKKLAKDGWQLKEYNDNGFNGSKAVFFRPLNATNAEKTTASKITKKFVFVVYGVLAIIIYGVLFGSDDEKASEPKVYSQEAEDVQRSASDAKLRANRSRANLDYLKRNAVVEQRIADASMKNPRKGLLPNQITVNVNAVPSDVVTSLQDMKPLAISMVSDRLVITLPDRQITKDKFQLAISRVCQPVWDGKVDDFNATEIYVMNEFQAQSRVLLTGVQGCRDIQNMSQEDSIKYLALHWIPETCVKSWRGCFE